MKILTKSFILIIITIIALSSCAPSANIVIEESGQATIDLVVSPSPTTEILISNLTELESGNQSIFDKQEIVNSLTNDGFFVNKLETVSIAGIEASVKVSKQRIKNSSLFEVNTETKRIICNIDKKNLSELISTMPDNTRDYIDLFISPITTGENLTATEYENLIGAAYGPKIAGELKTAFFKISLTCPGTIDSVKTEPAGKVRYFAGNSATITIPLSYILSLPKPLQITITYK